MPRIVSFEEECSAESMVNMYPCLECSSESQLWTLLLWLFAYLFYMEDDIETLKQDSVDTLVMSDKQMLQAAVAIMGSALSLDSEDIQDIIREAPCLECNEPKLIRGTLLKFWCEFWGVLPT